MSEQEKLDKAKEAIAHIINRMHTEPDLRYHLGFGSKSFELLTTTASILLDEPLEKVENFALGK